MCEFVSLRIDKVDSWVEIDVPLRLCSWCFSQLGYRPLTSPQRMMFGAVVVREEMSGR